MHLFDLVPPHASARLLAENPHPTFDPTLGRALRFPSLRDVGGKPA